MMIVTALLSVSIAALVLFALLVRKALRPPIPDENAAEWLENFSVAQYRPMLRLLSRDDYEFLATQPGYHPSIVKKLRRERRKIFRSYLRCLSRDFQKLHIIARLMVMYSPEDRPDLARNLVRQRLAFSYALALVQFRFALNSLGLANVRVDAVLNLLESMRSQIAAPVQVGAAA